MELQSWLQNAKAGVKKWTKRALLIALLVGTIVLSVFYWGIYSEGVRSGVVVKISKKGWLFKTYEGQLNLQTFGANKSPNLISESFDFSVATDEHGVIKALEEASLSGERVSLKYIERNALFFWRGETKYFVVEVERLKSY